MKKLMIAAAAVAMAGATFAVEEDQYGYDFVATLKTTKGKVGTDVTTTIKLGVDNNKNFWYNGSDAPLGDTITNLLNTAGVLTNKFINGIKVPAIKKDAKGYVALADESLRADLNAMLKRAAARYNQPSAGQYCETAKIKDLAVCYRVIGTEKINLPVWRKPVCCVDFNNNVGYTGYRYTPLRIGFNLDMGTIDAEFTNVLFQVFGAQTPEKASKCEYYAAASIPAARNFSGYIAGQGAWDVRRLWVSSLSGNIVGTMDAPVCENCCTDPTPSQAFDCVNAPDIRTLIVLPRTAAFGSFRMKRNANKDITVTIN